MNPLAISVASAATLCMEASMSHSNPGSSAFQRGCAFSTVQRMVECQLGRQVSRETGTGLFSWLWSGCCLKLAAGWILWWSPWESA